MASSRDPTPDLTRSLTEAQPPLPSCPHLQPIASAKSRGATLPWQEPPGSGEAVPATPPPGRQPKRDLSQTHGHVELPYALARNHPTAPAGISLLEAYLDPMPGTAPNAEAEKSS